uniref:Tyrosine specific protein phosphatases domain-containing protein n=1 Tax=Lates calcarifer TaxID=8187 RepID=A0A4W6DSV5_LATCA
MFPCEKKKKGSVPDRWLDYSPVPASESFSFWDVLDSLENQNQELHLIINLTFTTKGSQVPSDATILSFKWAVRRFLRENWDNGKLIGVHCTHGLNRTGYLVCRYLIDVDGLDPPTAMELFNSFNPQKKKQSFNLYHDNINKFSIFVFKSFFSVSFETFLNITFCFSDCFCVETKMTNYFCLQTFSQTWFVILDSFTAVSLLM